MMPLELRYALTKAANLVHLAVLSPLRRLPIILLKPANA